MIRSDRGAGEEQRFGGMIGDGRRITEFVCFKIRILTTGVERRGATWIQKRVKLVEQFLIATTAVGQECIALAGGQLGGRVKEFLELSPALAVHEVKAACTLARVGWAGVSRLSRFSIVRMGVEDGDLLPRTGRSQKRELRELCQK